MFSKIANFIHEAKVELLKVDWPTKKQVTNYTLLILGISLVLAVFLGGLDSSFSGILKALVL